jgi:hypothetical protein
MIKEFSMNIDSSNMDIFDVYRQMFIMNLAMLSDEKYKSFFYNIYMSMNYKLEQRFKLLMDEVKGFALQNQFNRFLIKYADQIESFSELNKMITIVSMNLRMMKIANGISDEEILRIYDIRMEILRGNIRF